MGHLFQNFSVFDRQFVRVASTDPIMRQLLVDLSKEAKAWDKLPNGWTQESVEKFWGSLTGDAKHKVTKCIERMSDKFDDPGAFCASLADKVTPGWRSKKASGFKGRTAAAAVTPIRQRTQYTCMAASMSMCLKANGMNMNEDTVNRVMGAKPMQGASWEQAIAAAQHFGMRATLTAPCSFEQLRRWVDDGVPVMIAWNPEGRPWSHASVVFDVTDTEVHVADPNIPDPSQTVRVVSHEEFFSKWGEKWPEYIVRRPAMAIEREVTLDGRQYRVASTKSSIETAWGPTIRR